MRDWSGKNPAHFPYRKERERQKDMMTLKVGEKELKIKFGYKPTLKERVISKIVKVSNVNSENGVDLEKVEDLLLYLPEILLVGIQIYHEEYRYNYDTKEGKQEQLDKAFDLIDEYASNGGDLMQLFNDIQEEMQTDSFLVSLFQKEQKAVEAENTVQMTEAKENSEN